MIIRTEALIFWMTAFLLSCAGQVPVSPFPGILTGSKLAANAECTTRSSIEQKVSCDILLRQELTGVYKPLIAYAAPLQTNTKHGRTKMHNSGHLQLNFERLVS